MHQPMHPIHVHQPMHYSHAPTHALFTSTCTNPCTLSTRTDPCTLSIYLHQRMHYSQPHAPTRPAQTIYRIYMRPPATFTPCIPYSESFQISRTHNHIRYGVVQFNNTRSSSLLIFIDSQEPHVVELSSNRIYEESPSCDFTCPPVTLSSGHPVLRSPCPPVTLSSGHPVLRTPCPLEQLLLTDRMMYKRFEENISCMKATAASAIIQTLYSGCMDRVLCLAGYACLYSVYAMVSTQSPMNILQYVLALHTLETGVRSSSAILNAGLWLIQFFQNFNSHFSIFINLFIQSIYFQFLSTLLTLIYAQSIKLPNVHLWGGGRTTQRYWNTPYSWCHIMCMSSYEWEHMTHM